ncbi:MAG: hypothetical protein JJU29_21725 [Verrucomicrobia bacterium]|nr:hypothetical protein [Verrucomicrobiota bacterium]MCH8511817.1 hypothetical protein [Kiritimatiellia bacterium]
MRNSDSIYKANDTAFFGNILRHRVSRKCLPLLLAGLLAPGGLWAEPGVVLTEDAPYRVYEVYATRTQGTATDFEPIPGWDVLPSPVPDSSWTAPDFDDSGWPLHQGLHPDRTHGVYGYGVSVDLFRLAVRSRFHVEDPANAGNLTLHLTYRGGVAVYLNGELVTTRHLPEGELTDDTHAADYPESAHYLPDGGNGIPPPGGGDARDAHHAQRQQRIRASGPIVLPAELLRSGVNVLSLDFRRAVYPTDWRQRGRPQPWGAVGLIAYRLETDAPGAVWGPSPTVAAPFLWNAETTSRIGRDLARGNLFEPLRPVRLIAARGGVASGQVVLSLPEASAEVSTTLSPLSGSGGTIPGESVSLSFAAQSSPVMAETAPYFDLLHPAPVAAQELHPVWVTVEVPADTAAGVYEGELTVSTGGQSLKAPVRLEVADWLAPSPSEQTTFVGLWHSPYNVALQYEAEPWSDRHLALLRPLHSLMGRLGNDVLYVNAIRDTLQSLRNPVLVFTREGDSLEPDFTFVEKYLQTYADVAPAPRGVVLYAWEVSLRNDEVLPIVIRNPDGSLEDGTTEMFGRGASERLWKAVVDGLRQRMDAVDWSGTELWIGVSHDGRPDAETIDLFLRIAPESRWNKFSHWRGDPPARDGQRVLADNLRVALGESPWGVEASRNPMYGGWQGAPGDYIMTTSGRGLLQQYFTGNANLLEIFRCLPDISVSDRGRGGRHSGISRAGVDYWQVPLGGGNRAVEWNRRPWGNLWRGNAEFILGAGVDGPIRTIRYEMLREGLQEAEARIAIERVLRDETLKDRVPTELTEAFEALQLERLSWRRWNDYNWTLGPDWQDRTFRLFELAGKITAAAKP